MRTQFKASGGIILLLLATAYSLPAAAGQTPPETNSDVDAVSLVFLGKKQPVLIRINVHIDGKPRQAQFDKYLEKWFRYLDVNQDGLVDAKELSRAPIFQVMRQLMAQGTYAPSRPPTGFGMNMAAIGKEDNHKLTLAEFQGAYRGFLAPIEVVPPSADNGMYLLIDGFGEGNFQSVAAGAIKQQASDALFKALDLNKDGKLSKNEILAAAKSLRKFDLEGTECLTTKDLVPNIASEFGTQVFFGGMSRPARPKIGEPFYQIHAGDTQLAGVHLTRYAGGAQTVSRQQLGLDKATFAKLDKNGDGKLDAAELAHWHERPADLELTVDLAGSSWVHTPAKAFASFVHKLGREGYELAIDDARIQLLQVAESGLTAFEAGRLPNSYAMMLRKADANGRGFVTMYEVDAPEFEPLYQAFPFLDWNGDGKLTVAEIERYQQLQSEAIQFQLSVTLADHGKSLFQLLDTNGDGRLSPRELMSAWTRLATFDMKKTGFITRDDLPRQFILNVKQASLQRNLGFDGQISTTPVKLPKGTPDWFRKMDTNGDGDVSFAEFLGTREEFDRINISRSGLISPEEAIRYDKSVRGKKR